MENMKVHVLSVLFLLPFVAIAMGKSQRNATVIDLCSPEFRSLHYLNNPGEFKPSKQNGNEESPCNRGDEEPQLILKVVQAWPGVALQEMGVEETAGNPSQRSSDNEMMDISDQYASARVKRQRGGFGGFRTACGRAWGRIRPVVSALGPPVIGGVASGVSQSLTDSMMSSPSGGPVGGPMGGHTGGSMGDHAFGDPSDRDRYGGRYDDRYGDHDSVDRNKRLTRPDPACRHINFAFNLADKDGNGVISIEEILAEGNMTRADIERMVIKRDLNMDKQLQPNEISTCPWEPMAKQTRVKRCDGCDCDSGDEHMMVVA